MKDLDTVSRRDFTLKSALAVLAGATITVTACDSDSPTAPTEPNPGPGGETGTVSSNHSHVAQITAAQLTAGDAISLDIQGSAAHAHTVELYGLASERARHRRGHTNRQCQLTMDEVAQIADGERVSKESSVDPSAAFGTHSHTVTFN